MKPVVAPVNMLRFVLSLRRVTLRYARRTKSIAGRAMKMCGILFSWIVRRYVALVDTQDMSCKDVSIGVKDESSLCLLPMVNLVAQLL